MGITENANGEAMSVHDEALVREIVGELSAIDTRSRDLLPALLRRCHRDVRCDTRFAVFDGDVYRGHEGVAEFFRQWLDVWADWSWTPVEVFATPTGITVNVTERRVSFGGFVFDETHVQ